MKKVLAILLAILMIATLAACGNGGGGGSDDKGFVGIAMPTQSSPRWVNDGANLVAQLEELGYRTILQYGEDVVADQIAQIEDMIVQGVDFLVIASIDGSALGGVLAQAAEADITVIAYDRLIMDTADISFYTTFDNFAVGVMQANSLLLGLGINDGATGPFNIELFGGSPDDNNAFFFYDGAMSVLEPLIEDGTLVVQSGQVGMQQVGTLGWAAETAQSRMEDLLNAFYADQRLDAVLSPYDGISLGILSALRGAGYGSEQDWPVVSGQDATRAGVQSIIDGEQFATVFKDTRDLAAATVRIIEAITNGTEPPINNTTDYNNNVFYVPSYLLDIVHVDATNWEVELIDTGYWTLDDFNLS